MTLLFFKERVHDAPIMVGLFFHGEKLALSSHLSHANYNLFDLFLL